MPCLIEHQIHQNVI